MLTPSTTHPESPFAEPSYPVFVYERIPGAWSFLGVMPHYPTDTVSPIREEVDDGTGVCPPGYTLVAMQPCFVGYIVPDESSEAIQCGDCPGANPATATITRSPPVPVETTSPVTSLELSTFDYSRGYRAARDATYALLLLIMVVLLSLVARSYMRRSKKGSRENAKISLPVADLPQKSPSGPLAIEKAWNV
ncbi:hypothetical protein BDV32DRAFT_146846 [Aspergillus pseudonomiae]|uniref:Uncharacterized protein n=1 Tax=Aspergillus pseudonomiae TaxID=1506151 RepID=A0A5N7DQN4_9EURO|nr:uncharacterized protein BDV37DRAFT_278704 [Aspergillus pseudonomiae]KAB8263055.1 hypothetical protein BDV32DRAFT_146846 [Aspergillus pseudonomiae]KAE8408696.1 hypothetical protein BDV37DRAFT_278704 [Aspergillus pseudonomiae]